MQQPVIVGAGPGGAAAALQLSNRGIPCVLVDQARFPRDKVCGDGLSSKVTTLLHRLSPDLVEALAASGRQIDVWGMRFVAPNGKALDIPVAPDFRTPAGSAPGYVIRRFDFDDLLVREVRARANIRFVPGTSIRSYERIAGGFRLVDTTGRLELETPLVLAADGANSFFSRKIAGLQATPRHHAAGVRAYFEGVGGFTPGNFVELHFIRELIPGYLWIFPLPDGGANVGLGMRSDHLKRKGINLRKLLPELLAGLPQFRDRFRTARQIGPVAGFGMPLGSHIPPISDAHYLLIGDAGHLIDPLTGEGIGNAIYSGIIAADQAAACLAKGDFSASFLQDYDRRVARVLGKELKMSYLLQRIALYPRLTNLVVGAIRSNQHLLRQFSAMYADLELRDKMINPLFWLNGILGGRK